MSFYVLEVISSRWNKSLLGCTPYRITWKHLESGYKICEIFIKTAIESERGNMSPHEEVHIGFHFYKYEKSFDFSLKPSDRPTPVSNVYIPSQLYVNININKLVGYSLDLLESTKNGSKITTITEEELNQTLKEIESEARNSGL